VSLSAPALPPLDARQRAAVTRLKLLYFMVFAAYGTTSIYRTLYYRRVGLSNSAVGALIAVQPLVMLVAGPLWSLLADRLNLRERLFTIVALLSIVPMVATAFCTRFWPLMAWDVLYAAIQAPMQPLMDSGAVTALGPRRHEYSVIRAFGSLGYAPMVYLTGVLVQHVDLRWSFAAYAVLMVIGAAVSLGVRSDEKALRVDLFGGLGTVGRDRAWLTMMAALFVTMLLQGVTFNYAGLYLDTLGASESLIGLSGAIGSVSQVLLMVTLLPGLVQRWSSERLMVFSMAMFALRLAVWSFIPNAWAVAVTEVMMGITSGTAQVGAVDFAARRAPPGMAATSQALMSSLVNGLGRATGSAIVGPMYDTIGPQALFAWFMGCALVSALGFGGIWRREVRGADRKGQA